jgi:hypothetical protein
MLKVGKRIEEMLYFIFELFCNLTLFIILMFETNKKKEQPKEHTNRTAKQQKI